MSAVPIILHVASDGGARPGNPGPMHIGFLIYTEDGRVKKTVYRRLGSGTNNVAEYAAAYLGCLAAIKMGATHVKLESDSQLMVRQLKGAYKVNGERLRRAHRKVLGLFNGTVTLEASWVGRTNPVQVIADALSRNEIAKAEKLLAKRFPNNNNNGENTEDSEYEEEMAAFLGEVEDDLSDNESPSA